ncbi:MAG: hypothetical protein EOO27_09190 [Comamonadaceae bacterium]|nr:MAG: hypothetical protein EOO27_09190 [Comamonadaceae bacterium]
MMRRTPMKRTPFARKEIQLAPRIESAVRAALSLRPSQPARAVMALVTDMAKPIPKDVPVRSEAYRRLVAALPCMNCRIVGYSQAAHPNTGKGQGTKTDDRLCFPLCTDRPGTRGCHSMFDQGAMFSREGRRLIEQAWGADTRRIIIARGEWLVRLPLFDTSDGGNHK